MEKTSKKERSEAQKRHAQNTKKANKRAWVIYHKTVEKWIEKNWTGKGWKRVQFEVQDYFPLCLKRAWKEIKAREFKSAVYPGPTFKPEDKKQLSDAELMELAQEMANIINPPIVRKVRKTRMNDKARSIVLAFNETGQIAKEAIKKAKKTKVADNQGDMFAKDNTQNNQLSMF
jgi:hypothetical protein